MENPDASASASASAAAVVVPADAAVVTAEAVVVPAAAADGDTKRAAKPVKEVKEESRKRQDRRLKKAAREKLDQATAEAAADVARMHAMTAESRAAFLTKQAALEAVYLLKQEAGLCPAAVSVGGGTDKKSILP